MLTLLSSFEVYTSHFTIINRTYSWRKTLLLSIYDVDSAKLLWSLHFFILFIFTYCYVGFKGQEFNIIYRTDSWRKHPSSFHFTMLTLLCSLAESFYTLPIPVGKRKIPSWERASHIFILLSDCKTCPFVASPWVAVGVYMNIIN